MLGIFGGTFNPIHFGHLSAAWQTYQSLQLSELRFMPCHKPPHRAQSLVSAAHRLAMVKLAIAGVPGFSVDDRELKSKEISYTVNSLKSIRQEVGDMPLCLILSVETFNQLHTWHQPEMLLKLAHLVVVDRPNVALASNDFMKKILTHQVNEANTLRNSAQGLVYFEHNTPLAISATDIRDKLAQGQDPRFLLPEAVLKYIQENKLYQNN